jgi:hypothetical protein
VVASWPLSLRGHPDLEVVDQLARLQLAARRAGSAIQLRDASPEIVALLDLAGLREVLTAGVLTRADDEDC